jgi:hypothetical protein
MKNQLDKIKNIISQLLPYLKEEFKVESLGIFGSYVRQDRKPSSDIDLLVTFSDTPTLFQFIELENQLSEKLGIKVDLVMKSALKPRIKDHILNEVVTLI